MTNSKTTKRALLTSVMALVLCFAMLTGTTFAWFTDTETSSGNKIVAGNLDIELRLWNGTSDVTAKFEDAYTDIGSSSEPIFGVADKALNSLNTLWEPGKTQVAYLAIKNAGNLDLKYQVNLNTKDADAEQNLYEVMEYNIIPDAKFGKAADGNEVTWDDTAKKTVALGVQAVSETVELKVGVTHYFALAIHMDENAGNQYKEGQVEFDITVLATQLNSEADSLGNDYDVDAEYPTADKWDGTADISWYDANATKYVLDTAEEFYGFATLVNGGTSFEGKTITLERDIDLNNQEWTPIGAGEYPFNGTFDGNNKTISNVKLGQNSHDSSSLVDAGGDYGYAYGLFGVIGWQNGEHKNEKVTIRNLNLEISFETSDAYVFGGLVGADAAAHKGSAKNSSLACDIEISNITVNGNIISTNNASGATVGGVVGKLYTKGNIVIDGCTNNAEIKAETSLDKDNKVGGILGFYSGANSVTITNNTNNGDITSKSARSAGSKASGICITGKTEGIIISNNTNNGNVTGTENAVAAIAFSGNDSPIYKMTQHTTENNSNSGKLYTLNYQTFEKTEVSYTFLVYGGKSQTPANNTTDDVKYEDNTPVLEINETTAGQ